MSKKTTKPGDVAVNVDESNGKAKKDGKAKGRCSRILGVLLTLLLFIVSVLVLGTPAWFEVQLPQRGVRVPARAGLLHFCDDVGNASNIETLRENADVNSMIDLLSKCDVVGWTLQSRGELSSRVKRMYIQYTIVRVTVITALLVTFILFLRFLCFSSKTGLPIDFTLAVVCYIIAGALMSEMQENASSMLIMFTNLDDVIDYEPSRDDGDTGPSLKFDVCWYLNWIALILCIPAGLAIRRIKKHVKEAQNEQ